MRCLFDMHLYNARPFRRKGDQGRDQGRRAMTEPAPPWRARPVDHGIVIEESTAGAVVRPRWPGNVTSALQHRGFVAA
jgi:hypothetical protein